ncbi:hypothetical protein H6501_04965 [Candidatus Woesearchaeota archaeon]|nr:hypothetical protein [Nanoarchaeota archaeon]MCB9370924.1 hypothetical protein [Candidatus Woesearchaeota archaeon]USN44025.1 MAG: hypothetical protein H6500_06570 [Candidatus Woesearchaeota archaeon]
MLWIKRIPKYENLEYLYLRETLYKRDKRSLCRKSPRQGTGKATKERAKYTKKHDIYCGKITSPQLLHFISFEEYLSKKQEDFTKYKLEVSFDELLDDYTDYLLYMYNLKKEDLASKPKQAYKVAGGYLCPATLQFIREFKPRQNLDLKTELERFSFRCEEAGISDKDIIASLFLKRFPREEQNEEGLQEEEKQKFTSLSDFIRRSS